MFAPAMEKSKGYYGKKGFTLYKSQLDLRELCEIRDELTMKPSLPIAGFTSNVSYPIYRESGSRIYVPRYYGYERFGIPETILITPGMDINLKFNGNLFEYQENIIEKYIKYVGESGGGLLDVEPGKGKTVMALNIISKMKKKTLVVVHKSFLLNQWKERIEQFLPSARVGIIQGKICDVDDKDIVIGMLQTLCTKKLPQEIIDQFGLSVYDECHHLSAEVFCNCMINIVTNYNLGLSGTMTRKDGLTKVFKYFIGPVVHKEKSDNTQIVTVKTIQFDDPTNEQYNEVETDYKGNPMYSKMITKICNNDLRTSAIVNIIKFELMRNYEQQIMILAHNKTLINELLHRILKFEPSTGLYVGGMKENELKVSEGKKVIIATYAMASEGLDIKTLTTLLMATPKSDICQSVGRILRSKHSDPMVIDVIDTHQLFQNQFQKRKKYYKSKKYILKCHKNLNDYLNCVFKTIDYSNSITHEVINPNIQIQKEPLNSMTKKCLININSL